MSCTPLRRRIGFAATAVALGIGIALVAAEIALRAAPGGNFRLENLRPVPWQLEPGAVVAYDGVLGYVPNAGVTQTWRGGWTAHINAEGLRANGNPAPVVGHSLGKPVLAVGDSGAFGDEVEDSETWPAKLEQRLQRRVLNGGVGGYGIDQMLLRTEQLVPRFSPAVVVLSFVSDDVRRCAFSFRDTWRPFYSIERGELVLTLPPASGTPLPNALLMRALGHSYLARAVLTRTAPGLWGSSAYRRVHRDEREVARLVLARLGSQLRTRGIPLLVVALSGADADVEHVEPLLAHARANSIETLDLSGELAQKARDPAERERWFRPKLHLSGEANGWAAGRIAGRLDDLGWLQDASAQPGADGSSLP